MKSVLWYLIPFSSSCLSLHGMSPKSKRKKSWKHFFSTVKYVLSSAPILFHMVISSLSPESERQPPGAKLKPRLFWEVLGRGPALGSWPVPSAPPVLEVLYHEPERERVACFSLHFLQSLMPCETA